MTPLMRRSLAAAPDAAAAAVGLWIWLRPLAWMRDLVGVVVLALLMEFVVIQAMPFIGRIVYGERLGLSAGERRRKAFALGAVYLVLAGLAAASFGSWFPFFLFLWLFGAKVAASVLGFRPDAVGRERDMAFWMVSNVVYFALIFAAMLLPVPMLGITEDGSAYGLNGRYEWANHPNEAVAAAFVYYGAMALMRLIDPRIGVEM
jgi:hypothetical protein